MRRAAFGVSSAMALVMWLVAVNAAALIARPAAAAGFYLTPRGVRPLARAGAFVAGADDVHALSYNPAGLAGAERQLVLDAGLPLHTTTFSRSIAADGVYEPPATGRGLGVPSPTFGLAHDFGLRRYGLGFGLSLAADYPLVQNWSSAAADALAPQRYAIGSFDGTALVKLALGVGIELRPWLSLGVALPSLVGQFSSQMTISTCDGASCVQPEDPRYDAVVQMQASHLFVPGVHFGAIWRPKSWLRVGLSWESGYHIAQQAHFRIRLPTAPIYAQAVLSPAQPTGEVRMRLPQTARLGVEARRGGVGRIELAAVFEPWHVHDNIDVRLDSATLRHVVALDTYSIGSMRLARGFRDTYSVRLGGEWTPRLGALKAHKPLTLRGGLMYEPSAIPVDMMTPMSVDLDKVIASVGAAYAKGRWQLELSLTQVLMASRTVSHSRVYQTNPVRPAFSGVTAIGNGHYQAQATVVGAGIRLSL